MKTNNGSAHISSIKDRHWFYWLAIVYIVLAIAIVTRSALIIADAHSVMRITQSQKTNPSLRSTAPAGVQDNDEPEERATLQTLIDEFAESQPAEFYIYAKNLKTGETVGIKSHEPVPSGSIYKMFLANYVYKQAEAGQLNLDAAAGFGGHSIHTCTMLMVRDSSNDCGEAVRATLGADKITGYLHKQGYENTNVAKAPAAVTSAYDLGLIFERLYEGGYFSDVHNAEYMGYLRDQMWTFRIPEGIPRVPAGKGLTGTRNKTGDVYGYANDGAIVLGENTDYVLVVLSGQWPKVFPDSSNAIRHLSGLVYNYMNETEHELIY